MISCYTNRRSAITLLSGGKSRRMGQDKASLLVDNKQLLLSNIEDAIQCNLDPFIASSGTRYSFLETLSVTYVNDAIERQEGPLSAVVGALQHISNSYHGTWLLPTDQLVLPNALINTLKEVQRDARQRVICMIRDGNPEPLFGWYPIEVITELQDKLNSGVRSIQWIAQHPDTLLIEMPHSWYNKYNFNTPNDIREYSESK